MAHENIEIEYNKICRGPVAGSLCYVSFNNPTEPVLHVISYTGGIIQSFDVLGALDEGMLVSFEYVGPPDLGNILDDSFIYTLERIDNTKCIFKIFKFDTQFSNLNLYHHKIFSDFGDYSFDLSCMCVEYYYRSFSEHTDRFVDYIYVDNINRLRKGDTLFIGPSNDPEYVGMHDVVRVKSILRDEKRVYITPTIRNQYVIGDPITFCPNIYFFSKKGIQGDSNTGSLLKVDNREYNITNMDTKHVYQMVRQARWCPFFNSIGMLFTANVVFCNPYNYYINVKSMFLNNFLASKKDFYTIEDIVFVDNVALKLSNKVTLKDSVGKYHTYYWDDTYNFHRQTLTPYVNTLNMSSNNSLLPGAEAETNLFIKAIDQFGIGLKNVEVVCNIESGGPESHLDPLSGYTSTDSNGEATVGFISDIGDDMADIIVETNEGSSYSGHVNVFSGTTIWNEVTFDDSEMRLTQRSNYFTGNPHPNDLIRQVITLNMHYFDPDEYQAPLHPRTSIWAYSFFSAPGGNWVPEGNRDKFRDFLWFLTGKGEFQGFREANLGHGAGLAFQDEFAEAPTTGREVYMGDKPMSVANRLTTMNMFHTCNFVNIKRDVYSFHLGTGDGPPIREAINFSKNSYIEELGDPWEDWDDEFLEYYAEFNGFKVPEDSSYPYESIFTKLDEYDLQVSQLNYSLHNYHVDGMFEEELLTYLLLDQFIFVQDAKPAFYSHKNPVYTDIWLRLRPFAYSLDPETLNIRIRKVSKFTDSGIINITNKVETSIFDAGGSLNGVEVLYDPAENFDYNSIVYVYLEIEDFGGNKIKINYWFTLIHDYRIPYITNLKPNRLDTNVDPNTTVYLEVKDEQTGVDISSFVLTVNTKVVFPQRIEKINRHHYIVEYTHHRFFMYGQPVDVGIFVGDLADQQNWLRDGYTFYVKESSGVYLTDYKVGPCKYGVSRYSDISFLALDLGDGVDEDKLRLQVNNKDITDDPNTKILPVIYKII